ncbi:serine-rich adhesin for platelets isoform X2 [Hetaerina americana]|uniref:serine-rich adhesin for platelets isoform X2 n=1 Tax=Hetaerina americana TaxID=62018 RepID=UPI003A7F15D2
MASGGGGGPAPHPAAAKAPSSASPSKASSSAAVAAKAKRGSYQSRQRRMGPAPFASFEDLSDELESPDEAKAQRALLPGIREDSGLGGQEEAGASLLAAAICLQTPSTPRIDISRASSSSQHEESGGSSGGAGGGSPEGRDPLATVAGLAAGFKEEGTADLRSSTEELDYHGTEREVASTRRSRATQRGSGGSQAPRRKSAERMASPLLTQAGKYELDAQSDKERKDSACSEGPLGLLGVGGRTSRLSSVGSAGSGASGASGMSGLSAASALSGAASSSGMRSPSPHKMLLETSFCGSKPIPTKSMEMDDLPPGLEAEVKPKKRSSKGKEGEHPAPDGGRLQEKPVTLDLKTVESHYSRPSTQAVDGPKEAVTMTPSSSTQSCQSTSSRPPPSNNAATSKSVSSTPSASPKLSRHSILRKATEEGVVTPVSEDAGQSPSPATSRKSSFTGLFGRRSDSGNLLSPESPTVGGGGPGSSSSGKQKGGKGAISAAIGGLRDRSRSRSKSREHIEQTGLSLVQQPSPNSSATMTPVSGAVSSPSSVEPKTKKDSSRNKGVFSSFFKKKDKSKKNKSGSSSGGPSIGDTASEGDPLSPDTLSPDVIDADGKIIAETIGNVEFTFNGDSNYQNSDYGLSENDSKVRMDFSQKVAPVGKMSVMDKINTAVNEYEDKNFPQNVLSAPIREEEERELRNGGKAETGAVADIFGETVDMESADVDHHSSESEREVEYLQSKEKQKDEPVGEVEVEMDHERKGLVLQQDSFEDELPYIPTTLPQERSVALPIKPVRQRTLAEIKTCPIERPRSTTPINPSALEDFLVAASTSLKGPSSSSGSSTVEERDRLRISLPREDSATSSVGGDVPILPPRSRSPRYGGGTPGTGTISSSWVQFTEDAPREVRTRVKQRGGGGTAGDEMVKSPASQHSSSSSPPPLPPRGCQPPPKQWVNFEEIPEKRKTPKKLHDASKDVDGGRSSKSVHHQRMVYSYVNPEDCKCECHETGRPGTVDVVESGGGGASERSEKGAIAKVRQTSGVRGEGAQSLVGDRERRSSDGRKDSIVSVGEVSRLEVDNLADRHSYQRMNQFLQKMVLQTKRSCYINEAMT